MTREAADKVGEDEDKPPDDTATTNKDEDKPSVPAMTKTCEAHEKVEEEDKTPDNEEADVVKLSAATKTLLEETAEKAGEDKDKTPHEVDEGKTTTGEAAVDIKSLKEYEEHMLKPDGKIITPEEVIKATEEATEGTQLSEDDDRDNDNEESKHDEEDDKVAYKENDVRGIEEKPPDANETTNKDDDDDEDKPPAPSQTLTREAADKVGEDEDKPPDEVDKGKTTTGEAAIDTKPLRGEYEDQMLKPDGKMITPEEVITEDEASQHDEEDNKTHNEEGKNSQLGKETVTQETKAHILERKEKKLKETQIQNTKVLTKQAPPRTPEHKPAQNSDPPFLPSNRNLKPLATQKNNKARAKIKRKELLKRMQEKLNTLETEKEENTLEIKLIKQKAKKRIRKIRQLKDVLKDQKNEITTLRNQLQMRKNSREQQTRIENEDDEVGAKEDKPLYDTAATDRKEDDEDKQTEAAKTTIIQGEAEEKMGAAEDKPLDVTTIDISESFIIDNALPEVEEITIEESAETSTQKKKRNTETKALEPCRRYITGTCKYGIRCWYHHPIELENRNEPGIYRMTKKQFPPLDPCWYYMNSECNFPFTCKHPHPTEYPVKEIIINTPNKPQGLTNLEKNMCFAISAVHMLARLIPPVKEKTEEIIETTLRKTANLLNGKYEESSPDEVATLMWRYSKELWPEYKEKTQNGSNRQNDAPEFLMRLISKLEEENKEATKCLKAAINCTTRCTNEECSTPITSRTEEEYALRSTEIPDNTQISLQMIVDNFIPQITTRQDTTCQKCGGKNEETNTLILPSPILMIHVDKVLKEDRKTETKIEVNQEIKIQTTENSTGESYTVTDVIIHYGTPTNGHYIITHYNDDLNTWEKINNAECTQIEEEEARSLNKDGVLFAMRRNKCIPNTKPRIEETLKTCDKTRVKVANKEQTEEGNYKRKGEQQDSKEYYVYENYTKLQSHQSNPWSMGPAENNPWSMISNDRKIQDESNSRGTRDNRSSMRERNSYGDSGNRRRDEKYVNKHTEQNEQRRQSQERIPCKWFMQGRCAFQARCWNYHPQETYLGRKEENGDNRKDTGNHYQQDRFKGRDNEYRYNKQNDGYQNYRKYSSDIRSKEQSRRYNDTREHSENLSSRRKEEDYCRRQSDNINRRENSKRENEKTLDEKDEQSNKRNYIDRDAPEYENNQYCWRENIGECVYEDDCWFSSHPGYNQNQLLTSGDIEAEDLYDNEDKYMNKNEEMHPFR